jgi:hypothetical protein
MTLPSLVLSLLIMSVSALTALSATRNISCRDNMTKSLSHSKHLENQHALGLTNSGQICCDDSSQCINIAAKDSSWLANFFLLKKVELAFPFLCMGKQKLLICYYTILWAIAHVLCHPQPLSMGPKLWEHFASHYPWWSWRAIMGPGQRSGIYIRINYWRWVAYNQPQYMWYSNMEEMVSCPAECWGQTVDDSATHPWPWPWPLQLHFARTFIDFSSDILVIERQQSIYSPAGHMCWAPAPMQAWAHTQSHPATRQEPDGCTRVS